jgi:CheY-like chemotaxis protein
MESEIPPPTASQQRSISQILKGGWYLLRLINEILDLAMIESGKITISLEPMSLAEVLQDCNVLIGPLAKKRGIQLIFPHFGDPLYVMADLTRVKQVAINLLSNAIKYNREGGTVTIRCDTSNPDAVRVYVRDTGAGLDQGELAQLFQPFNRIGKEESTEEGTGIGLVVTKQLVELMHGDMGVSSIPGTGTEFWFEFPTSAAPSLRPYLIPPQAEPMAVQELPATDRHTLLYIEDNPANLALVEQLIERRTDLKLLTAINGHLGIALARAYQPEVILMDINLPGLSGFGALKVLQDDPATSHIPVLALSANAVPRDIQKGIDAGFFRYLTKPINVVEFMDALDLAFEYAVANGLADRPQMVE